MIKFRPNILLITIDCARADMIYGSAVHTPHIDKLRKRGVSFSNAYSQSNVTIPALTSLFTSRYLSSHGVITQNPFKYRPMGNDSLPAVLNQNGWQAGVFVGFDLLQQVIGRDIVRCLRKEAVERPPHKTRLWRRWKSHLRKQIRPIVPRVPVRIQCEMVRRRNAASKRPAPLLVQRFSRWLQRLDGKPFFSWVHFFDAHQIYDAPERWLKRYYRCPARKPAANVAEQLRERGLWFPDLTFRPIYTVESDIHLYPCRYRAALSYVDEQIGVLVNQLTKSRPREETLIIISADHGENLMENGIYCGHHKLFDETTRVPLIIVDPQGPADIERDQLVQHIDLLPTLLRRLDIPVPAPAQGTDLAPCIYDNKVVNSRAFSEHVHMYQKMVRTVRWQYFWRNPSKSHPWGLHFEGDLLLDRERNDGINYASSHPEAVSQMAAMMEQLTTGFRPSPAGDHEIPVELEERLAALGYIDL